MNDRKTHQLKVLILDDNKFIAMYLDTICRQFDLSTTVEIDPARAMDRIKNNEFFEILIIDNSYANYQTNGLRILMEIKRIYVQNNFIPYIPVLSIAAGIKELYKKEAKEGIIFDFIEKPFEDAEIKKVLMKAVGFLKGKQDGIKPEEIK